MEEVRQVLRRRDPVQVHLRRPRGRVHGGHGGGTTSPSTPRPCASTSTAATWPSTWRAWRRYDKSFDAETLCKYIYGGHVAEYMEGMEEIGQVLRRRDPVQVHLRRPRGRVHGGHGGDRTSPSTPRPCASTSTAPTWPSTWRAWR